MPFKDSDWYKDAEDREEESMFILAKMVGLLAILSLAIIVGILLGLMR